MKFMTLWTDDWLAGTHPLTPEQRGVYITLICHFINKDRVIPDNDVYLARLCNMPTRPYRRAKKALVEGDFLEQRDGHLWIQRTAKQYEKDQSFSKSQAEKAKQKARYKLGNALNKNKTVSAPDVPTLPLTLTLEESPLSPPKGILDNQNDFGSWWNLYPRKVGKLATERKYKAAIKKGAAAEELVDGLGRYIEQKPEDQDWCHPSTWLSQGRWMDEENKDRPTEEQLTDEDKKRLEKYSGLKVVE